MSPANSTVVRTAESENSETPDLRDPVRLGNELLTGFAGQRIRGTARRISKRWGLSEVDEEDLAQELRLHLASVAGRFDPDRGSWRRFASVVISRRALSLVVAFRRASISKNSGCDTDESLLRAATPEDLPRNQGRTLRSEADQVEFRDELSRAVGSLPHNLQSVCEGLTERTIAELSALCGIPRRTLRDKVRMVREVFLDRRLDEYL